MALVQLTGDPDGVRVLTLDDPDRRNALSPQLLRLPALFGRAQQQPTAELRTGLRAVYDSFLRVRRLEIPTVAAVQGAAVGAGVNLAMSCDVRLAGPRARFGVTFSKLGLHPGGGCTWFLTQALGRQRALALILDGELLDADEALRLGLVLDVVEDPLAAALDRARAWAAVDPLLARDMKRAVGLAETAGFEATLDFESWAQAASAARSPQLVEAVARFTR